MILIKQKRIRNVERYLPSELSGKEITFVVNINKFDTSFLDERGFKAPIQKGQCILPSVIGSISRFNADGKEIPLRNEDKETKYRDFEFTRFEWHGRDKVEVTDSVWIPYKRYPRQFIKPPSIELSVIENNIGEVLIKSPSIIYNGNSKNETLHIINLMLELFGECHVFEAKNQDFEITNTKKLHWEVLPKGELPWEQVEVAIRHNKRKQAKKSFEASIIRFKEINTLKPDFHAVGSGGYQGYVVFGFNDKNLYVFESQFSNNATYIFDKDWEELSRLTKAEIIAENLHVDRLIHNPKWSNNIRKAIN